ncbi:hydrolase [Solicola sp. PLA-1-18]|uniref:hydrolase n=1 Tax=Solicola sp. PLA-1-18 TaxID=3380532 RepID=UPI003B7B8A18
MSTWICVACGVEHRESPVPPEVCDICADERQYVPPEGQAWATPDQLADSHGTDVVQLEPGLHGLVVEPRFAIGQHTLLLRTPGGNLLWEPSGVVTERLVEDVRDLGGVAAVAASHPHLVGAAATWAARFDAPFWFNDDDRRWLRSDDAHVRWWTGTAEVLPGVTLVQAGGHFPGSAVAHWADGADGRGELFTGDTLMVGQDRASVSFMRSYPNLVPLSERLVRRVVGSLEPLAYDRLRSGFGVVVESDARAVVERSADRYVGWITDRIRDPDERLNP